MEGEANEGFAGNPFQRRERVYADMDEWRKIRYAILREGKSKRKTQRETGMHWKTLEKVLLHPEPPGYRMSKERQRPKLGPYLKRIEDILHSDKEMPKKQRHTAKRIFERIAEEGYQGKYTVVKDAVRQVRQVSGEVFMPLVHRPGEAQVDFGFALAKVGGVLRKVAFFVMVLPYSDAFFVMAFERECTETYWEGHLRAFEFFGGVPTRISYDNAKVLAAQILGPHERKLTDGFKQLLSHYLFKYHFCRVRRPNEKGVVEGVVKYSRLNFFVPVPQVKDLEALNVKLAGMCRSDLKRRLRGKGATKTELLAEEQEVFHDLPSAPMDACRKAATRANSLSLVRFDRNDYSVPVRFAHHPITAKGYVNRVVLCHHDEVVAVHSRCWEREQLIFDYRHYLALLERKPGALDYALPLADLNLPACFDLLRRRLELAADPSGEGTREYIRILRLLERHPVVRVKQAVEKALGCRAPNRDVVAMYLLSPEEMRPPRFRLAGREHLRGVEVASADLSAYGQLLADGGAP